MLLPMYGFAPGCTVGFAFYSVFVSSSLAMSTISLKAAVFAPLGCCLFYSVHICSMFCLMYSSQPFLLFL